MGTTSITTTNMTDRGRPTSSHAVCLIFGGGAASAAGSLAASGWTALAIGVAVVGMALVLAGVLAHFDA